ncbi:MAG: hypothetical protein ACREGB_03380 [Candidatus Saccharimonadales bacterium]
MLFAIAGPSGVGKTFLIRELLAQHSNLFISPRLATTRPPRRGSNDVDRHFVTKQQFDSMHTSGEFMYAGEFQSHWYGFPKAIAEPQPQHVVVNIWPKSIPQFAQLPGVKIIGLSVDPDNFEMLRTRMLARGDTDEIVENRMAQIVMDLADLTRYYELVTDHGKMFEVIDDSTVPEEVIPWILETVASKEGLG